MFQYYLTEDHKYGVLHQDHFTDMFNGDMDGTNNTSETINRGLKRFSNHGKKHYLLFSGQFTILRQIAIKNAA